MKKHIQTRLHTGMTNEKRGNCFPSVISCIMDLDSPEDVLQIQEYYNSEVEWKNILQQWLNDRGFVWKEMGCHINNDLYYIVIGKIKRFKNVRHVCIYKNGELFHDPNPCNEGLISEDKFEIIEKL